MSLSVKEILNIGQRQLEESGIADASIDNKILYCYLMHIEYSRLILEYQRILPDAQCDEYFKLLDERCTGVPVQYITGSQEFMGLDFMVNESVLIPRQDTETMVEDAISIIKENKLRGEAFLDKAKKEMDILDLCTGSGAIGLSIAKLCSNVKVTCSDLSKDALSVARKNSERLDVSKKVSFQEGNLLMPFKGRFKTKKFDMIISNPPYIKTAVIQTLQREVKDHEPMMALDGGADGLDLYKIIVADAADSLKKDGILMLEIGHDQREELISMIEATERFENVQGLQDLAGRDRIIVAKLMGKKKK